MCDPMVHKEQSFCRRIKQISRPSCRVASRIDWRVRTYQNSVSIGIGSGFQQRESKFRLCLLTGKPAQEVSLSSIPLENMYMQCGVKRRDVLERDEL